MILVAVVGVVGLREHFQNVKPHLDFARKRNSFFDLACEHALERLRRFDDTARLNIMEIRRKPIRSWSKFEMVYTLNMEDAPDKDLGLRLDQGVCGEAVRREALYVADLEAPTRSFYGMDERQRQKTEGLTLIFSMPIKRVRELPDGSFAVTDEILGVVNIDSSMPNAYRFYENTKVEGKSLRGNQTDTLKQMSETCSIILS